MRDARAVRRALNAIELCMMPLLAAVPSATSAVMAKTGSRDHSSFMTQRVSKFKIKVGLQRVRSEMLGRLIRDHTPVVSDSIDLSVTCLANSV